MQVVQQLRDWVKPAYIDYTKHVQLRRLVPHPAELVIYLNPLASPAIAYANEVRDYLRSYAFNRAYTGLFIHNPTVSYIRRESVEF